ncbi:MAG TPA: hypothetical protein VM512_09045, partial [Burkholderiaceae bacterium]|nr:hypothetical protein [Burkholderiaceae bacterium]
DGTDAPASACNENGWQRPAVFLCPPSGSGPLFGVASESRPAIFVYTADSHDSTGSDRTIR